MRRFKGHLITIIAIIALIVVFTPTKNDAMFDNWGVQRATSHVLHRLYNTNVKVVNLDGETDLPDTADGHHSIGFTLPSNCVVYDVFFYVNTADDSSGMTIDLGDTSDYDGFADGISMATTGIVYPGGTFTTDHWTACNRGAYLRTYSAGTNNDTPGVYVPKPTTGCGGNTIYVTNKDTFPDFDVDIYIMYQEID